MPPFTQLTLTRAPMAGSHSARRKLPVLSKCRALSGSMRDVWTSSFSTGRAPAPPLCPRRPRPRRHRYQALAAGHALQLAVHVLQVCRQHLLGLQGIFTLGFTLLQLDPARGGEARGEVSLSGPLDRPSPPAWPRPFQEGECGQPFHLQGSSSTHGAGSRAV